MSDMGTTTRIQSVLAGIREYLTGQLDSLDLELKTARQSTLELREELALSEASIEHLVAGRDLLASKVAELDRTAADSGTVARARRSRRSAGDAVAPGIVALVQGDAVVGALPDTASAAESPAPGPDSRKTRTTTRSDVLAYLQATSDLHKVIEVAAAVSGPRAQPADVQAIRRALAALVQAGQVEKSTQSGTVFYSATPPVPAEAPRPRASAAGPKTAPRAVRADRAKIVAVLLAAAQPQSAPEVSRAVMGDQWKPSDANNFRHVLKTLVQAGTVAISDEEGNRSRYTAVPKS